ncbi:MAG: BON domain-containing protein [Planctomycetota bacterium]|nr:MAG: BON domain-containing protein [Planctomycetota bacterium]REJ93612.1 MAG: BON domain-containing protein [Planctomycetota bacterium]REK19928.1 MAG: BON domain-containing protein [Planctomycetota bacterium]REK27493.1 MAG: BON domain-containing protein [Planctomycetota bacterium]
MRLPRKWVLSLGLLAAAPGVTLAGPLDFFKPGGGAESSAAAAPTSNQAVANAVATALGKANLNHKNLSIEVENGVCTLTGEVGDSQQRAVADRIARSVSGVENVQNQLTLMQAAGTPQHLPQQSPIQQAGFEGAPRQPVRQVSNEVESGASNEAVAREVAGAVGSAGLQGYDIEIRYKSGVAALLGDVGSPQEAMIAEQAARGVSGVNQVINRLTVNGEPIPARQARPATPAPPQYPPQYQQRPGVPAQPAAYPQQGAPQMRPPQPGPGVPAQLSGHRTYNAPNMPEHAWPTYAQYDNYAAVSYPSAYDASAWPYIGPFYPYPQVPLEWRAAELEWNDGQWELQFHSRTDKWWWFLNPSNWN